MSSLKAFSDMFCDHNSSGKLLTYNWVIDIEIFITVLWSL